MTITKEIRNLRGEIGRLIFDQGMAANLERPLGHSTSFLRFIFIKFSFSFKSELLVPFRFSAHRRNGKKAVINAAFYFFCSHFSLSPPFLFSSLNIATSIDFYPFVPCRSRNENNRFRTHKHRE